MYQGSKFLAVIPARGGSKGVSRKNIRIVGGKPLVAWTIIEGKKSKYIDKLILSSDDAEIIQVAEDWGCKVPFVRPKELALDETGGTPAILHALDHFPEYDYVIMLQPTSPLRTVEDIDRSIEFCLQRNANACVSVKEPEETPYWMFHIKKDFRMELVLDTPYINAQRQEVPKTYIQNGAVFIAKTKWLREMKVFEAEETITYIMPQERSVDIDTELDLIACDHLLSARTTASLKHE